MGDLIGNEVAGTLWWVPVAELTRLRQFDGAQHLQTPSLQTQHLQTQCFADVCRLNALYMIARAGSGHIGSTFSSLDIVSHLHLQVLRQDPSGAQDIYFSSKGHDAPGLYAVLIGLGVLPEHKLHELRRLGGLPGHPDVATPGIATNTGSLGMGISKAKGMALARRRAGRGGRIYVLTGDGELQEGQIWESLIGAANQRLSEITVIVDHNKLQSDTFVDNTSSLGDLEAKFRSFGAHVSRVNGHDVAALADALSRANAVTDRLQVIIADTVKGRGVSFMEHTSLDSDTALYRFHSGAPDAASYTRAATELIDRIHAHTGELGIAPLRLNTADRAGTSAALGAQSLIESYKSALLETMQRGTAVVALDADLCVDTGQGPAKAAFPERHIECGIAEMDMVSMAGGMALQGLIPVCHSFACFLTTRANEQIYNNATEGTKVVYVASLAGLLPAGPGHSHQSVRDISALGAVPGLTLLAPGCPAEVAPALAYAVETAPGSTLLRLESQPTVCEFEPPRGYQLEVGKGYEVVAGVDAWLFGYGPLLLNEALKATHRLNRHGLRVGLVNLPWLNRVDRAWLIRQVGTVSHVFTLDNHYVQGGQGQLIAATLSGCGLERAPSVLTLGLETLPQCGESREVLHHHALDADSLAERVRAVLRG